MSDRRNFVSLALAGKVSAGQSDVYVDQWHDNPSGLELHEYLGMTREEYAFWLREPDQLASILAAKKLKALCRVSRERTPPQPFTDNCRLTTDD